MKIAFNILFVVGVLLLLVAIAGIFSANPSRVLNIKITSMVLFANTAFLLVILMKMFDKK